MEPLVTTDPEEIGPFRLLARVGTGGMGRVYLGRTPTRPVAIKVIQGAITADPEFRDRFAREIALVGEVRGPYTASLVDAAPRDPTPWMATEYVPGPSLNTAIDAAGPLPEPALRILAAGLAEALRSIHAAHIIHRDLKPGNILLSPDGPRVIDFGIAKLAHDSTATPLTEAGGVLGTPGYMSPEQVLGRELSPLSDVFGLGAILYQAATGHRPFGPADPAIFDRVLRLHPPLEDVPASLRPVVGACLAKGPKDRPDTAQLLRWLGDVDLLDTAEWLPSPVGDLIGAAKRELRTFSAAEPPPWNAHTHPGDSGAPPEAAAAPPSHSPSAPVERGPSAGEATFAERAVGRGRPSGRGTRPSGRRVATMAGGSLAGALALLATLLGVVLPTYGDDNDGDPGADVPNKGGLRLATGPSGGSYHKLGGEIARQWSSGGGGITVSNRESRASGENLRLLDSGDADLAIALNGTAASAVEGSGGFRDKPLRAPDDIVALGNVSPQVMHVATQAGSGIGSIDDLKGARVEMGPPGSGTPLLAEKILIAHGIDPDSDIDRSASPFGKAGERLANGEVDAMFSMLSPPSRTMAKPAESTPIRFLPVTGQGKQRLLGGSGGGSGDPNLSATTIDAGTYPGQDEPVPAVGNWATVYADSDLDTEVGHALAARLYERADRIDHRASRQMSTDRAAEARGPVPLHPGARRYYQEATR